MTTARCTTCEAGRTAALGALIAVVLASGCSADYRAERLYWQAEQAAAPVLKNPAAATPGQFGAAQAAFAQVIARTPGTFWAARAQGRIATFYALQQRYDQARQAYEVLVRNYVHHAQLCLWARQAIARTYETQERWPEAVAAYEDLMRAHPWSQAALETPLYIARGYEQREQAQKAHEAYDAAVGRYVQWIAKAPVPEMVVAIKHYLAIAYQRLQRWDDAVSVLQELAEISEDANRPLTLVTLGAVYQEKLRNPAKAQAAYVRLIETFPQHPLANVAREQLEKLPLPKTP